ncbi:MAG: hypothetical protein AAGI03_07030 [Pseudomonadota bacterium]
MRGCLSVTFAAAFLAGCATTTDTERAFQECRWEEGIERDQCVERELADYRWDDHQAMVARIVATRQAEHRESVCLAQGGSDRACEAYGDFGPDTAAPDPIEVSLSPVYPDPEY